MEEAQRAYALSKVPEVTLLFWFLKILATTLGETGGDAVTMSMNLGYFVGTAIFAILFVVSVSAQVAVERFHPFLFWGVIVATTTAGTTLADLLDRSLGIGYAGGATTLFLLVLVSLLLWHWTVGSISISRIESRKAEVFYWMTVFFSQTLGTALGDWTADSAGLGYEGSAIVFATGLAVIGLAYYYTRVSRTFLFWTAFILTRPLGATLGDLLDKPHSHGGLELSRYAASAVLATAIVSALAILPQRAEKIAHRGSTR
jgi:uncharacterized membrane-anchored protein